MIPVDDHGLYGAEADDDAVPVRQAHAGVDRLHEHGFELDRVARERGAHPEARERIRLAGMRRARAEHTWHRRFADAFVEMGLGDGKQLRCAG